MKTYIFLCIILGIGLLLVKEILTSLKPKKVEIEKILPYECGFEPLGDTRNKFEIKFYIIGILFIIFDLEVIFLYPYGVIALNSLNGPIFGYWIFFIFILILTIGFIYEWLSGAINKGIK